MKPLDAEAFFASYLAFFVVVAFYIVGWVWKRQAWHRLADIDVDSGRREIDWEHFNKTRAVYESYPKWRKFLSHLF